MDDRLLTTREFAERSRVSESTERAWRREGKTPRHLRVGRRVLYRESDVEAWLDEQRESAVA